MLPARLAEVHLFGIFAKRVADGLAVLAEEDAAVGIEHDALGLERARRRTVVAVTDHVGVVHVHVVLAIEHRFVTHALEEEVSHPLLVAADRLARVREVAVAQHRIGEPDHVEDDVQLLLLGPGEDVLGVVDVLAEHRRRDAEVERHALLQLLHRAYRFAGLLEAALHLTHFVVHLADAVNRHAGTEDHPPLVAQLGHLRQHRYRAMRRQPGRVDTVLPEPR